MKVEKLIIVKENSVNLLESPRGIKLQEYIYFSFCLILYNDSGKIKL